MLRPPARRAARRAGLGSDARYRVRLVSQVRTVSGSSGRYRVRRAGGRVRTVPGSDERYQVRPVGVVRMGGTGPTGEPGSDGGFRRAGWVRMVPCGDGRYRIQLVGGVRTGAAGSDERARFGWVRWALEAAGLGLAEPLWTLIARGPAAPRSRAGSRVTPVCWAFLPRGGASVVALRVPPPRGWTPTSVLVPRCPVGAAAWLRVVQKTRLLAAPGCSRR